MSAISKYKDDILNEINGLSEEQIVTLIKIIHLFKESLFRQREHDFEIREEFAGWERLSDEALTSFENSL